MNSILRIYDPPECDERGVPLDWERCRLCEGTGAGRMRVEQHEPGRYRSVRSPDDTDVCGRCDGHGSLKAAALAGLKTSVRAWDGVHSTFRCEGCGHPMSEGTWQGMYPGWSRDVILRQAEYELRQGREPTFAGGDPVYFSRCDERCKHGGPGRVYVGLDRIDWRPWGPGEPLVAGPTHEASWRQVDVRTLGWPHDLRPEKLAVLCLRCWAAR